MSASASVLVNLSAVAAAYLLGAIPFGLIIAKLHGVQDLRQKGSGNIGATNVWRTAGPKAALWVYLFDIGKGFLAVSLASQLSQTLLPQPIFLVVIALAAVIGHIFPLYLGFHGGKGVNTALGVLLALLPREVLISLAVFLIVVAVTRYISLGSLAASLVLVIVTTLSHLVGGASLPKVYVLLTCLLFLVVVYTHRQNIRRLRKGTEHKFSFSSRAEKSP